MIGFSNPLLRLVKFFITPLQLNWIAAGTLAAGYLSSQATKDAASSSQNALRQQSGMAQKNLAPYRQFGESQLGDLQNWLSSSGGAFNKPTMEEIQASPGYASRLGAIENSAAARGSLFSGNALRNIGEFGASEYNQELARRQNELQQRLGLVNLGQSSAAGTANIQSGLGNSLANIQMLQGQQQPQNIGNVASGLAGAYGQYQGQNQWNDFLARAYPEKTTTTAVR